jgi:glycosyltransferase involved in cell wall biosynthesis
MIHHSPIATATIPIRGPLLKILFLIRSLQYGGAERQLVSLAKGLRQRGHDVGIAVFYAAGDLELELKNAGCRIVNLDKHGRWDFIRFFRRFRAALRSERPNVLHGYLTGANVLAAMLRPVLSETRIVWGVRSLNTRLDDFDWFYRLGHQVERLLARFADLVIVNSRAAREQVISHGLRADRVCVVFNGIDTDRFRPSIANRRRVRAEWGFSDRERVVGLVGRLDPMKDHPTFLRAAAIVAPADNNTRFVCVGDGPPRYATKLHALADDLRLGDRLVWAGPRVDMPAVYNAFDVLALSSSTESFPNVIAEAMATEVPCVASDVGDAKDIIGDTGEIVPPGDPEALAAAITRRLSGRPPEADRERMRARIVARFSVARMVAETETALQALIAAG